MSLKVLIGCRCILNYWMSRRPVWQEKQGKPTLQKTRKQMATKFCKTHEQFLPFSSRILSERWQIYISLYGSNELHEINFKGSTVLGHYFLLVPQVITYLLNCTSNSSGICLQRIYGVRRKSTHYLSKQGLIGDQVGTSRKLSLLSLKRFLKINFIPEARKLCHD